jgi:hypothetical protein
VDERRRRRLRFLAAALAIAAAWGVLWMGTHPGRSVPPLLEGRWVTDTPGYEGRWFEIDRASLTIETAVSGRFVHPVLGVERRRLGDRPVYELHFRDVDGRVSTFRVVGQRDDLSLVQIEHRAEIWRRVPRRDG